jgi:hypothetical protein
MGNTAQNFCSCDRPILAHARMVEAGLTEVVSMLAWEWFSRFEFTPSYALIIFMDMIKLPN